MSELKVAVMTGAGQDMMAAGCMNRVCTRQASWQTTQSCLSRAILPAERSCFRHFPPLGIGICQFWYSSVSQLFSMV